MQTAYASGVSFKHGMRSLYPLVSHPCTAALYAIDEVFEEGEYKGTQRFGDLDWRRC